MILFVKGANTLLSSYVPMVLPKVFVSFLTFFLWTKVLISLQLSFLVIFVILFANSRLFLDYHLETCGASGVNICVVFISQTIN